MPDGIVGGASFAGGASLVVNARAFWSHGRRIRRLLSARLRSQVLSYSMFVRCANFFFADPAGVEVLLSADLSAVVANAVPVMLLGDSSATVFVACDVAAELGNVACVVDSFPFGDG